MTTADLAGYGGGGIEQLSEHTGQNEAGQGAGGGEMERRMAIIGGVSMFIAVLMGAFGAHGLKGRLTPEMLDIYKTAVLYQMVHSIAVLAVAAIAGPIARRRALERVCWVFVAGIVLFSGSLYLLALTGDGWLAIITPFGGLCFLGGWALVVMVASSVSK